MTVVAEGRARRARWLPTTRLGRVACWLALAFVAFFVLNQALVASGGSLVGVPRGALLLWGWLGLGLGAAAGLVASVSIVRRRERALLVFAATLPLLLVVFLLAGELLAPH